MKNTFILILLLLTFITNTFAERFVAIGESNHSTSHGLDELIRVTKELNDDVTRIFIEGPRDYKDLYISLSISDEDEKKLSLIAFTTN